MGVALRDLVSDYRTAVVWEQLAGVAAIDAHNAIYQFLTIIRQPDGTPLMDRNGRITSHLSGLLFRTQNLVDRGIKPVYIFDGPPPSFKRETVEARREQRDNAEVRWAEALERGDREEAYRQARLSSRIDAGIVSSSHELLDAMGIPWINAPSEGEAQAVHMVTRGAARYVVSQDYDALLFGAPLLVRNLAIYGKRKVHGRAVTISPERILLNDLLTGLGITREDLIEIAILVGTDFNQGIRGIGGKKGLKIVKQKQFDRLIGDQSPDFDPGPVKDFFLHPPVTDSFSLEWRTPDIEGVRRMLCDGYDFSPERVTKAFEGTGQRDTGSGQKTLGSWF